MRNAGIGKTGTCFCYMNNSKKVKNIAKMYSKLLRRSCFIIKLSNIVKEAYCMKINKRKFKEGLAYHIMVLPMFIMFTLFVIYPFCSTIFYSFTDYSSSKLFDYEFVGLENYMGVFESANQIDTIVHTLKYAAIITVVQTLVALVLALALTVKFKTNNFLRTIFFFPAVLSPLVVGYLWSFLFSTSAYGPINNILESLGLDKINFFGDPDIALYSVLFTQVWQWAGYSMVIIIANLKSIDQSLYEVSAIDGASKVQQFFHITLPMLYPSMNVLIVTGIIGGLKVYDIIVSTTGGGPFYATTTIVQSIISQAIGGGQYGLGAALSVVFLLIILTLTQLVTKILNKWEEAIN